MSSASEVGVKSGMEDKLCVEIDQTFKENSATSQDWRRALDKVVPAIVVLRITACRAFDTESAGVSYATGFVVDKRRGIILTNRHVVKPGPVTAEALFVNREEIPVHPLYRDPVHDFGFFRYDTSSIQFLNYEEIPLAPEAACVGLEIRVVGNDSGEKVSILAGTLARLDRAAPVYKRDGYNDFNTFYIQAASGTKGGSSGSPVIDWQGRAVALNAGSKTSSASAFFLPLERVVRALKFLGKGRESVANKLEAVSIPRGTLQATFLHQGFDEMRRLGLRSETEQIVRHASPPGETGMLVVDSVVPGGPAHKHLEPGDVLVRLNGEVTTQFLKMENLLDDNVNHKVELQIERGGKFLTMDLTVQDLHSITPDHFLEVGGAVIHPLSYQQARNFHFQCGLVYVADQGYMLFRAGVPRHAIIKKFAGVDITRLEDFITVLSTLSRGVRVPLEYISYMNRHLRKSVLVTVDLHEWYAPPQIYTRNDSSGLWAVSPVLTLESKLLSPNVNQIEQDLASNRVSSCNADVTPVEQAPQCICQEPMNGVANMKTTCEQVDDGSLSLDKSDAAIEKGQVDKHLSVGVSLLPGFPSHKLRKVRLDASGTESETVLRNNQVAAAAAANASVAERVIEPALVMFEVHVPSSCMLDGVPSQHFFGTGVIIYHSQTMGLVAVNKNIVFVSVSDVLLSFAAYPIEVPGEVVFLHPLHNFALVAYNPSALGPGASVVRAAELLPEPVLCRGDSVCLVGLSSNLQAISRKSFVTNPSAALNMGSAHFQRHRGTNMELIELDAVLGTTFSGVLTDDLGRVRAIWGSFAIQLKFGGSSELDQQFSRGIPIYSVRQILDKIVSGADGPPLCINGIKMPMPLIRILEVELYSTLLVKARSFGLTDTWIKALVKKDPIRRQVLTVKGCLAGSKAENLLEQGDMVLAINKVPVTCFRDIEDACQELDRCNDSNGKLTLTIFRQGREIDVLVGTDVRDGNGSTRMINWCGCVVQDPHPAVRALGFLPKEGHGAYATRWCSGSPTQRYGLYALQWIVEVNGKPTPNLDALVAVTKEIEHGEFVRVRTIHLNGRPRVLTLKQDLHYWPTWELRFDPETAMWRRRTIKALDHSTE
ncbi:protease Do-like 7 [Sesamum indicum]|uniref:Pro-apoptotic serine protease NMA111 n=1 Tax=Sesamum indicum TaxID=4182 RepID=A0A6I9UMM0_SESIN|nr:protease Do-like 7 [Sesamum indicum]